MVAAGPDQLFRVAPKLKLIERMARFCRIDWRPATRHRAAPELIDRDNSDR